MIEPRKRDYWWSLRGVISGDNTGVPNKCLEGDRSGTNVRPGSESRAKQNWGLAGRWESLPFPWASTGQGETGLPTSLSTSGCRARIGDRKRTYTQGIDRRGKPSPFEMNEGSLSLCIVAIEQRGTHPKDPCISQGGGRIIGSLCGTYAWTTEP